MERRFGDRADPGAGQHDQHVDERVQDGQVQVFVVTITRLGGSDHGLFDLVAEDRRNPDPLSQGTGQGGLARAGGTGHDGDHRVLRGMRHAEFWQALGSERTDLDCRSPFTALCSTALCSIVGS